MKYIVLFSALVLVSSCTAPRTPNARRLDGDQSNYLVTDARQRIVVGTSLGSFSRPGLADPGEIVCSEPSPDAASAVATTFSGALSVLGKGSGSLSTGQIESMSQLVERTASIQLLRDKMYQSCLAYANGAISGTTYSMIMAQLDRTIVSLLLGENAAAAFGRSGAAIGTQISASGNASLTGPGGGQDLEESVAAVGEAQEGLLKAEEGLAKVTKEKGEACGLEKASEAGPGDACKAIAAEESKVAEAENHLNATLRVLQTSAVVQSNVKAETSKVTGVGGLTRNPTPELARELRLMQDNFLGQDANDLFLPTCMVELGLHNQPGSTTGQILDELVAEYESAKQERDRAGPADEADAKNRLEDAYSDLTRFLSNPAPLVEELGKSKDLDPNQVIFKEVLKRWRDGIDASDLKLGLTNVDINDVVAAANLNRRSLLASACMQMLPAHLMYTRKFSEKYRLQRLATQAQVEIATAGNRDSAERARLLEQFQGALKACKEGDEAQRASCQAAVQQVFAPAAPSTGN
jgi:hypothetical protein